MLIEMIKCSNRRGVAKTDRVKSQCFRNQQVQQQHIREYKMIYGVICIDGYYSTNLVGYFQLNNFFYIS